MKTIEELSKLSDEELRVLCAKLCGWTDIKNCTRNLRLDPDGVQRTGVSPKASHKGGWIEYEILPNYPADLNVMHEAVKGMTMDEQSDYWDALIQTATGLSLAEFDPLNEYSLLEIANATARQRCIAFIFAKQREGGA